MICFATILHGQTFLTVKSLKYENNRVSAYNVQGYVVYQVDCKDFVWQRNPDLTIKIWDDIHSYTVNSTSLTSPSWGVVEDSLRAWQTACSMVGTSSNNTLANLDSTHQDTSLIAPLYLSQISETLVLLNSKGYDTSQSDTSLVIPNLIQNTNSILELIYNKTLDTTQTDTSLVLPNLLSNTNDILSNILSKNIDTTHIDTSLVVPIMLENIGTILNNILAKNVDTTNQDTSFINYINQFERNNDTLSAILAAINNSGGNDTSNYWILDSIYKELKSVDTFCLTGEIAVKDSLLRTTVVDCNGINALNVKVCNNDTSSNLLLSQKIDTTNLNLLSIIDSLAALTTIVNELQLDCIGSNETYYIDGTNSITLNASEVCSYTITVIGGQVDFSENGVSSPFSLPNGYTGSNSFKSGTKYLVNQVVFAGTNGSSKAIIKIIK